MKARDAELLAIGTELLGPSHLDTNGAYLSGRLGEIGIRVRYRTVVGDVLDDLREALRVAMGRVDLVVATGGLGPTVDDRTREAVASLLDLPLEIDADVARRIEARYRRHGIEMPPRSRQQAMVPRGAEVLANRLGTAPGLLLRSGDKLLALLPGVPSEMRDMAERSFLPRLGPATDLYARRVLRIAGLPESEVDRRLEPVARLSGEVEWTILACPGEVSLHLSELCPPSRPAAGIRRLEEEVERILGPHLFGRDEETMESVVGRILSSRGETLAVAESLTGGLVAERVTSVPGASRYFRGGVVCYSDAAKLRGAGVSARTLDRHGAVSAEVACEMARGVRGLLESTWGLAATGYAGPEGGEGGPPGTAWIALSGPGETRHRGLSLPGDRDAVRRRAAMSALDLLRRALMDAAT